MILFYSVFGLFPLIIETFIKNQKTKLKNIIFVVFLLTEIQKNFKKKIEYEYANGYNIKPKYKRGLVDESETKEKRQKMG